MWPLNRDKDSRRRKAVKRLADNPLKTYLSNAFPATSLNIKDSAIIAVDFETTGLNAATDHILSIGLVVIEDMAINLQSAWHQLVQVPEPIPESSAVIHRITDDQAAQGMPLDLVLPELLQRLSGHVLLVHHAAIEQTFLDCACRDLYDGEFIAPVIDTEALARRSFEKRQLAYQPRDLRLFNLRRRYGLPDYTAHNALSDALATAELFLAIVADKQADMDLRVKDLLSR